MLDVGCCMFDLASWILDVTCDMLRAWCLELENDCSMLDVGFFGVGSWVLDAGVGC